MDKDWKYVSRINDKRGVCIIAYKYMIAESNRISSLTI